MSRFSRRSKRSSSVASEESVTQETVPEIVDRKPTRSRKRSQQLEEEDEDEDDQDQGFTEPQPKRRSTGGAGFDSGDGSWTGGAGSGTRRLSGFDNLAPSQDMTEGGDGQGSIQFSQSAESAREIVAKVAAASSKDLQIEQRDEKKASDLSSTEKTKLIKSMMRFLIMKGLNREPATKKEMLDLVMGKSYRTKGVLKYVMSKAGDLLKETVGFKLKAVGADKPFAIKDTYYVINALNNSHHAKLVLKGQGQAGRGLLTVILCLIYCTVDKRIAEDELYKKLHEKLDNRIPKDPKKRADVDGLGDVSEHLATFVKQHYLLKSKTERPNTDGGVEDITSYSMGARSYLEVGNQQVVVLMSEIMGQSVDPSVLVEMEDECSQSQTQATSAD